MKRVSNYSLFVHIDEDPGDHVPGRKFVNKSSIFYEQIVNSIVVPSCDTTPSFRVPGLPGRRASLPTSPGELQHLHLRAATRT
jgi:hypothetical protein